MTLRAWGWDERWEEEVARQGGDVSRVARVVGQDRGRWSLQAASGPETARLQSVSALASYPVVGDWVLAEPGPTHTDPWSILAVLPRRSSIWRASAGSGGAGQLLAANVDKVWLVHGLDMPFNPRRLERFLAVVRDSGASPEVILTKVDLAEDVEATLTQVRAVAMGTPIRNVSSEDPGSVQELLRTLTPGQTVSLLGPSGVGKSTLVNLLAQAAVAPTGEVRGGDQKGRHTTTRRELFRMPCGALLLDAPGIRELRVRDLGQGLEQSFPDIEELARSCRFNDCQHQREPGCAIQVKISRGTLDPGRLDNFRKLQSETGHELRKPVPYTRSSAVADRKAAQKAMKQRPKHKKRT